MADCEEVELIGWLTLLQAPRLGAQRIAKLLKAFGSAEAICSAPPSALRSLGLTEPMLEVIQRPDQAAITAALRWTEQAQASILTLADPRYPSRLSGISSPPPLLFVRGDLALLQEPQLAIVGSRNPTPGGVQTTRAFASHLAGLGLVITSGMALGVDAAAHLGALESGRTIAVLGTGPDRVYPAAHRELARRISAEGALVSEFLPGVGPQPSHFPRRNRTISGLSLGTLVTEAAPRSGSLITARYAAEQGREVFAIPGSIHNPLARGCHQLIREGAKLIDSVDQLLEELAPQLRSYLSLSAPVPTAAAAVPQPERASAAAASPSAASAHADGLDRDYQRLLEAMGADPVAADELVLRTGLSAQEVSSMLLLLELQGHVSCLAGGRYCRHLG
ncbi:MAG: DNA-processing protein DprA [Lamprobacter sp.]|uniref:DNA-processing protein DprA n=1 Tax=Lamprobacter sp. TaxID=3100796 RepID=UPI002B260A16|nr:DNA-processing protein DprA [Lamprobacter sp.]MEA3640963.1 DNA-processing protein DprA [Lamprobacter sp.]